MSLNWALAAGLIGRWADVFSTIAVLEVQGVRETAPGLGSNPDPGVLMRLGLVQSIILAGVWAFAQGIVWVSTELGEDAADAAHAAICICSTVALAGVIAALSNLCVALAALAARPPRRSYMDELMHIPISPVPALFPPGFTSGCARFVGFFLAAPAATFAMYWIVTNRVDMLALEATVWSGAWWVVVVGIIGIIGVENVVPLISHFFREDEDKR
jgi:hypothetical protein